VVLKNIILASGSKYNECIYCVLVLKQYSKKLMTHKKFRQSCVESLEHEKTSASGGIQKAYQGRPSSSSPDEQLHGEPPTLLRESKRCLLPVLYVNQTNCQKKQYITATCPQ
jgi:hypothetical protein